MDSLLIFFWSRAANRFQEPPLLLFTLDHKKTTRINSWFLNKNLRQKGISYSAITPKLVFTPAVTTTFVWVTGSKGNKGVIVKV